MSVFLFLFLFLLLPFSFSLSLSLFLPFFLSFYLSQLTTPSHSQQLEHLNQLLENCFADPTMCIKHVHELVTLVRDIMANRNEHVFLFSDSIGEADMADPVRRAEMQVLVTDEFIQNILLLMQRQPQLVPNLMRCLAYLAGVSEGGLGVRCLEALQDLMEAGGTYKQEVIEVMNKCVIPQLQKIASSSSGVQSLRQKKNDLELRSVLLRGLKQIAERSGIG